MSDELVIDQSNFHEYFQDIKTPPQPGQYMARYVARAELCEGEEKAYLIDMLLNNHLGAEMGVQMSQNMFGATEKDAISMCKEIAKDLASGMTKEEVLKKPYSFTFEKFFWTKEEYVPKDNPHWQLIKTTFIMEKPEETE